MTSRWVPDDDQEPGYCPDSRIPVVPRAVLLILLLASGSACAGPGVERPPQLALQFRGLWFSESDAARLRAGVAHVTPSEDVALTRWNAITTDLPHPDIVNAQVRITVPADAHRRARVVALLEEWQIGGREGEETARWGERAQRSSSPATTPP